MLREGIMITKNGGECIHQNSVKFSHLCLIVDRSVRIFCFGKNMIINTYEYRLNPMEQSNAPKATEQTNSRPRV